jgi:hypothetical protein
MAIRGRNRYDSCNWRPFAPVSVELAGVPGVVVRAAGWCRFIGTLQIFRAQIWAISLFDRTIDLNSQGTNRDNSIF